MLVTRQCKETFKNICESPVIISSRAKQSYHNYKGGSMGYQQDRGGFGGSPREMHKAICEECKNECEVPFKPKEGRPVYCRDCFSKRKNEGR